MRWRTHGEHHRVQAEGRSEVFEDYHLRVGEITADSHTPKGFAVSSISTKPILRRRRLARSRRSRRSNQSTLGPQSDTPPTDLHIDIRADGLHDWELFESITNPGKLLILGSWRDQSAASSWNPISFPAIDEVRHREVRVIRDYGMFERREAPQYYPGSPRTVHA